MSIKSLKFFLKAKTFIVSMILHGNHNFDFDHSLSFNREESITEFTVYMTLNYVICKNILKQKKKV